MLASLLILITIGAITVRSFVRHHAPFYDRSSILIVGGTIGIIAAALVISGGRLVQLSPADCMIAAIAGILAISFVGWRPDRIDEWKKSRQTVIIAVPTYAIALLLAGLLRWWP